MKGEHKGFFLACIRVTEHNSTTAARLTEYVRELEMQSGRQLIEMMLLLLNYIRMVWKVVLPYFIH